MARVVAFSFLLLIFTIFFGVVAIAQRPLTPTGSESRPTLGGTLGSPLAPKPPLIGASQNIDILRHRDPTGKACLSVFGSALSHKTNPKLFDHVIMVKNNCAQLIKMQVCYYRTQQCISMDIPGRMSKEAVLGIMPSVKDFQYEFRERF
jgi:hypothetical protein